MKPKHCGNSGYPLLPGDKRAIEEFSQYLTDAKKVDNFEMTKAEFSAKWDSWIDGTSTEE